MPGTTNIGDQPWAAGTSPAHLAVPNAEQTHHALQMRQLIYGHLRSRAICTMAELRLADLLHTEPLTASDLAERTGTDPARLRRLLRALVTFGVLRRVRRDGVQDAYGLTPLGETLRADAPASALPTALLVSSSVAQAWDQLPSVVRTGRAAFSDVFGQDFFTYLGSEPQRRAVFDWSQETGLALELTGLLDAVDFSATQTVVDVGGGDGAMLTGLLAEYPQLRGILVDLATALPSAERRLAAAGLADRCELRAGDFFRALPESGGTYLLRHILHDWDDESCRTVLRTCRSTMSPDCRLVVIDHLTTRGNEAAEDLPQQSTDAWGTLMDLYMMSLFDGGQERDGDDVTALLEDAGLTVVQVSRLRDGTGVLEARPTTPAPPASLQGELR